MRNEGVITVIPKLITHMDAYKYRDQRLGVLIINYASAFLTKKSARDVTIEIGAPENRIKSY